MLFHSTFSEKAEGDEEMSKAVKIAQEAYDALPRTKQMAIKKAKRNGNPNEPKPKINKNILCSGCGKPIRKGQPFYKYISMMGRSTTYLHKGEECWELHYNKWRGIKRGRRRSDEA